MSTQTRRILIKVDTTGARDVQATAKQLGLLNNSVKNMAGNMGFLTNAFQGFIGFLGVREIIRMSDSMQNLDNRLKIITGSAEGAKEALEALAGVADRTNLGIAATGEIYTKLANSLKRSGANTQEVLTLTESLINTFRIAGSTTTETSNTIIQLAQAFSSGELRGQELRSVMEQNATLAALLQERFKGDVYKQAQQGLIKVSDVLEILADNQAKVAAQAAVLAPTFEQVLVKSMDKVSLSIGEINKKYELSAKFAAIMEVAVNSLGNALTVFGAIVTILAISKLPLLITQIKALWAATSLFLSTNPITAAFLTIAAVSVALYNNWERLGVAAKKLKANFYDLNATLLEFELAVKKKLGTPDDGRLNYLKNLILESRQASMKLRSEIAAEAQTKIKVDTVTDPSKELESLIAKMKELENQKVKVKKVKEVLGELNQAYLRGSLSLDQYNEKLVDFQMYKLRREFSEGKMDVFKFHEQLRDLKLQDLNRDLVQGTITLENFNRAVGEEKFKVLNEQMKAGLITLQDYNNELLKIEGKVSAGSAFTTGIQNYLTSIGTFAEGIAKVTEQAFGHLEDSFMSFIKTGKFNFAQFTQSVLDDLLKIIIRAQIIGPLAQGLMGAFGGGAAAGAGGLQAGGGNFSAIAAKGMAFNQGNVIPFAKGGIVDSPTAFSFGGGKRGLMGEAGSEAILPLSRGKNGDLGVQASVTPVTVNIINQSGAGVEQTESTGPNGEKMIDVLITNKVREGISTGKFDTAMRSSYGVLRKGA